MTHIYSWIIPDNNMELTSKVLCYRMWFSLRHPIEQSDIVLNNMTLIAAKQKYLGLVLDN